MVIPSSKISSRIKVCTAFNYVGAEGYSNLVLEINSESQVINFYNASRTATMDITNMWTGDIHMNNTHLVYGINEESVYAPGTML